MTKPVVKPEISVQNIAGRAVEAGRALSRYPHVRSGVGVTDRDGHIMTWRLPNGDAVQMYINPESLRVSESKQISSTRTKGGFVIQYWGENLTEISLQGTTGSSGVKGINVLRNIYKSENKGFDLVAAQQFQDVQNIKTASSDNNNIGDAFANTAAEIQKRNFLVRPSLASLATNVLLFYQGDQWKGYFTNFSFTESVGKLGLFDYSLTFMAYEKRGTRENFMPWHKEPLADDLAGGLINAIGNKVRGAFGLDSQGPQQFHPETAPFTFGGNSITSGLGYAVDPLVDDNGGIWE